MVCVKFNTEANGKMYFYYSFVEDSFCQTEWELNGFLENLFPNSAWLRILMIGLKTYGDPIIVISELNV